MLFEIFQHTASHVSSNFYNSNKELFAPEHLMKLSYNLMYYYQHHTPYHYYLPSFEEEIIPDYETCFLLFRTPLGYLNQLTDEQITMFANALENSGIHNLLVLLGQRLTPASVRDSSAIPPLRASLIESSNKLYNNSLTVAAREWTKHTNRSSDRFWGKIEGGDAEKNERAIYYINLIIGKASWWNVFFHYKHELVYELRLPSGHGARWKKDGSELIGFLEPFVS